MHERWAASTGGVAPPAPAEVVGRRRSEDLAALSDVGAEAVHLDIPDCIYRVNPGTGYAVYNAESAIFGLVHASELTLVRRVATKLTTLLRGLGRHHLFVPLGIGQHVDHQITRRAAEVAGSVYAYYEDFPYVGREGDRWPNPQSPLLAGRPLTPELVRLSEANLAAWIRATARYASQISTFWADEPAVSTALREFAERVGADAPAIRLWRTS